MSILIGGSPSTGSSLLRRMLNRHSAVFCGSETSILAKAEIYEDWPKYKSKLFKKSFFGLSNAGWHNFTGVELGEDYPWTKSEVKRLIQESSSIVEFAFAFFSKCLSDSGKTLWAEKTPSNAFTFDHFLNAFDDNSKVIHTIRHPLDAVSSLYNRGMTLYNALAVYQLNVAKAHLVEDSKRVIVVKYEDLVAKPMVQLELLSVFLGIDYEPAMLTSQEGESGVTIMKGWKSEETSAPNTLSIGRYKELPESIRLRMMTGIETMSNTINQKLPNISAIAAHYNYTLPEAHISAEDLGILKIDMEQDIKKRKYSKYYFKPNNYPIRLEA